MTVPETENPPPPAPADRQRSGDVSRPVGEHAKIAETDSDARIIAKLKNQGVRLNSFHVTPWVFWPALVVIVSITVLAIAFPTGTGKALTSMNDWIVGNLGWYYTLTIAFFIVFSLIVCVSPFGRITLGKDGEKPEFGLIPWFCMLFAAGMGIGLMFYGVGEPLSYATAQPNPGWGGDQIEHAQLGMAQSFVHWGLHPWAIYAVIGLAVAYTIHRRGRPISIRWALEPIFGDRVKGWVGNVIDIVAIFGTLFGVATSLGLGVKQIAAGMREIGIVDQASNTVLVVLIVCITFVATFSVVSGVGKGMKWLSNINLSMAGIVLVAVLLLGPTIFLLQNFIESLGVYFANVLGMTFDVGAYTGDEGATWSSTWTMFYWGWWISWAPFVGVFIARISRGRTVRQFIAGVLLVPSLVGFFWFAVMGGLGIHRQLFGDGDLVPEGASEVDIDAVLFKVLGGLPAIGGVLAVVALFLVAIFFITSSDSGSMVVDMLASGGHPNPPTWSRVLFSFLEGAVAIALLLAGGLSSLQAAALATALPFSAILVLMCVATWRSLAKDHAERKAKEVEARYQQLSHQLGSDFDTTFGTQVDHRVDGRIDYRLDRTTGVFSRKRPMQGVGKDGGSGADGGAGGGAGPGGGTSAD
jgi:choline/glycine/proline betaine transport protein